MRNVRDTQLKTAICITNEEFEDIIYSIFPAEKTLVTFEYDGILITDEDDVIDWDIIHKALEEYFDVKKITSIHIDDCDYPIGVWIIYNN